MQKHQFRLDRDVETLFNFTISYSGLLISEWSLHTDGWWRFRLPVFATWLSPKGKRILSWRYKVTDYITGKW